MVDSRGSQWTRRSVTTAALASVVGLAVDRPAAAVVIMRQRGMAGGGLVRLEEGRANLSLVATRLILPEDAGEFVVGSVRWVASGGPSLASTAVTGYDQLPSSAGEEGRRIRGTMSVDGAGDYPFVLDVFDAGPPGSGKDRLVLAVGDAIVPEAGATPTPPSDDGFGYAAAGMLATGDFQDVDFDIETGVG